MKTRRIINNKEFIIKDKKNIQFMQKQVKDSTVQEGEIIMKESIQIRNDWYKSKFNLEY